MEILDHITSAYQPTVEMEIKDVLLDYLWDREQQEMGDDCATDPEAMDFELKMAVLTAHLRIAIQAREAKPSDDENYQLGDIDTDVEVLVKSIRSILDRKSTDKPPGQN